jgi:hypothetical protein
MLYFTLCTDKNHRDLDLETLQDIICVLSLCLQRLRLKHLWYYLIVCAVTPSCINNHVFSSSIWHSEIDRRMSLTYRSEWGVFKKNSTPHTRLVIVKGAFKILSRFNVAPVPTVTITGVCTQMEPTIMREKCKCWSPQNSHKMPSFLIIAFFNHLHMFYFICL